DRPIGVEGERPRESLLGEVELPAPVRYRRHHEVGEGTAGVLVEDGRDLADGGGDRRTRRGLQRLEALVDTDETSPVRKPGLVGASAATAARRVAEAAQTFLLFGTQGHGPRGIASGRHRGDGRRQRAAQSLDALPLVARAIARLARIAREVEQLGLSAED